MIKSRIAAVLSAVTCFFFNTHGARLRLLISVARETES